MRKVLLSLGVFAVVAMGARLSYASDWDKFGKAMAVVEGARVLSGGAVDIIGGVTGINRLQEVTVVRVDTRHGGHGGRYERVWVPNYVKVREYVPSHYEFRNGRRFYVHGHYETKMIEKGGHWQRVLVSDRHCAR